MDEITGLKDDNLEFNDAPHIMWIPVQDAVQLLWGENPKEHDIGSLIQSIQKYGFQELPKYDATLPGIKSGNGRTYALSIMERNQKNDGYQLPRGIAIEKLSGKWVMPILAGTDAESQSLAKAYAVDSNNLTMTGGDFTAVDILRLWNEDDYLSLLRSLGENDIFTVSIPGETLDALLSFGQPKPEIQIKESNPMPEGGVAIKIRLGNPMEVTDAINSLRELIQSHPSWDASMELKK